MELAAPPTRVFPIVADLGRYQDWLGFVSGVQPAEPAEADQGPAWLVTLRTQVGPLARSKRLRMVRHEMITPSLVRFERHELDGRQHSPWTLESRLVDMAENDPSQGPRTELTMVLSYGGRLWSSLLDGVLQHQVDKAKENLQALVD